MPNYSRGDGSMNVFQKAVKHYGKEAQLRIV